MFVIARSFIIWLLFVIPWLDHRIQKNNKNTKSSISLALYWIPWSSHGMTK
ncbi:MAG: hypothetical protein ACRYE8_05930 [Janthinobacterium lividum]